jgi:hypothetical protein
LESDNGQALEGVGVRYKGYSSFAPDRAKNSLNIALDFSNPTHPTAVTKELPEPEHRVASAMIAVWLAATVPIAATPIAAT